MASFLERERCPVCASGALATVLSRDFAHPSVWRFLDAYYGGRLQQREVAGRRYEIARCALCSLLFQRFVLRDAGLHDLYERWISADESLAKQRDAGMLERARIARQIEAIPRLLRRRPESIRALDFGMGWGSWCQIARGYGIEAVGIELSEARRKYAQQLGIETHATLESIARGQVDFVNCEQVFEHLPEPVASLRALVERLAPRGLLRIAVPDARGLERRLRRSGWTAAKDPLHPLEHVNGFTRKALVQLGREAALVPVTAPRLAPARPGVGFALGHSAAQAWKAQRGTCLLFAHVRD